MLCFLLSCFTSFSAIKCPWGFRYLLGEEVDGMAYVVFGVMQDGQKRSFPGSLQRVQVCLSVCSLIKFDFSVSCSFLCKHKQKWWRERTSNLSLVWPHQWNTLMIATFILLDCERCWCSLAEERAHHTDLLKHPRPGGELHICSCQCADRQR